MLGYQLKIQFLSIYQVVFLQHLSSGISAASIKCKNQCSGGWIHPVRGRSVWTKRVRTTCPSHCLSNMVLGGKKGWIHENLRPFSLVLWFHLCLLFLLPTTSSVPEHPRISRSIGCRTMAPVNHHVPNYPLGLDALCLWI